VFEPEATREPDWLVWGRALEAIAQSGLAYDPHPFERDRYEQVAAIAAELLASRAGPAAPQPLDGLDAAGHATPKVDVRGAVVREGAILLVRERADGRWALPGGWADIGETPRQAVEREVREETGYVVLARRLAAVHDRRLHGHVPPHRWHTYKLFFECEIVGGAPAASFETSEVRFFAPGALPELASGKTTPDQIALCFAHAADAALPTEFD